MATLDDIIRDAINGTRNRKKPSRKKLRDMADRAAKSQGPLRAPLFGAVPRPRKPLDPNADAIDPKDIPYNKRPKMGFAGASKGGGRRRTLRERTSNTKKPRYK